ncbi:type IX secretion system motor protein PorM/GldM [Ferruginibacter albus]|uniref:type IX secretion system motor protein PorM/GldM n=1 Tax=Ferruginibacter albus TaxID=2875540 RepID=UPI001CC8192C|nr:gliding motility protein GldM [Ferruginibacter albus]UAY51703.1 gliding motility protein GldM [Ferruginibacter albus]
MALPKEPRQKMINIMYLVLTALLALNVSSEILNAFKVVDKSLQTSNKNIANSNATIYESLKEKMNDAGTKEKATIWNAKAEQVKKLSDDMYKYIDDLKDALKKEAGLKMQKDESGNEVPVFNESDLEAATRLFGNGPGGGNKGVELQNKLNAYKKDMLGIDTGIAAAYTKNFPVDASNPIGQDGKEKEFTEGYFHMTPTVAALTLLSKFQNNIKNAENLEATYCHTQVGAVKLVFNKFKPIATTSSTYLMPGEKMTVTAGVGAFNDAVQPQISIGGTPVALNDEGVATKEITASGGGDQKVHVSIVYTKPDGTKDNLDTDIPYTVGKPAGASVSLDKLNVFYIGLDNPITVGSPTGMDRTKVSGNNCSVSMNGAHGTVKVTAPGECSITVSPQGSTSITLPFRIKRIPEPEIKVGPGKARMASVEFKSQQFCRADMGPDFIYDVHYNVISATVYFSGANFSNVITASINGPSLAPLATYMQRCGPGSSITFDNVKVSGPDGVRVIEGKSFTLY